MVMYDNNNYNKEFETKEKKIWTKDKIEPQHTGIYSNHISKFQL